MQEKVRHRDGDCKSKIKQKYINCSWKFGRTQKSCRNTSQSARVFTAFLFKVKKVKEYGKYVKCIRINTTKMNKTNKMVQWGSFIVKRVSLDMLKQPLRHFSFSFQSHIHSLIFALVFGRLSLATVNAWAALTSSRWTCCTNVLELSAAAVEVDLTHPLHPGLQQVC